MRWSYELIGGFCWAHRVNRETPYWFPATYPVVLCSDTPEILQSLFLGFWFLLVGLLDPVLRAEIVDCGWLVVFIAHLFIFFILLRKFLMHLKCFNFSVVVVELFIGLLFKVPRYKLLWPSGLTVLFIIYGWVKQLLIFVSLVLASVLWVFYLLILSRFSGSSYCVINNNTLINSEDSIFSRFCWHFIQPWSL